MWYLRPTVVFERIQMTENCGETQNRGQLRHSFIKYKNGKVFDGWNKFAKSGDTFFYLAVLFPMQIILPITYRGLLNTSKHKILTDVVLLLGQHRRRLINIKTTLVRCLCLLGYWYQDGTACIGRPCKHEASSQCWLNDGPASRTVARHLANTGSMYHVLIDPIDR